MGIPAIVPSTCAAREVVEHGVTGLWFQSGDAADLERCMRRMLDADFARQLGRAAHRRFWQLPPTLDEHAGKLEAIYKSILGHHVSQASRAVCALI
jgi:glycosyltransferase involved in cell wall biosynthesis